LLSQAQRRAYLILQAVLCALVAGMLAAAAIRIYTEGAPLKAADLFYNIYTREKVSDQLLRLFPLITGALGMTLAGWILGVRDENAEKASPDVEMVRDLTCARVAQPGAAMQAERALQRKWLWGGWIGFALCMIPIVIYTANGAHFSRPTDTEADFFGLIRLFLPLTAAGLLILAVSMVMREKSMVRETEAAKAQIAAEKAAGNLPKPGNASGQGVPQKANRKTVTLRTVILILALVLLVLGILNGGLEDVFAKGASICTECVGLG